MNTRWDGHNRTLQKQTEIDFKNRTEQLSLRRRLDIFFIVSLVIGLGLLFCPWGLGVVIGGRLGSFDTDLIYPLVDERLLDNVYKNLDKKPMLAAVRSQSDGRVYMAQSGGMIHSYAPLTGLWSSENPLLDSVLQNTDFTVLRSGCGIDPRSNQVGTCPDT